MRARTEAIEPEYRKIALELQKNGFIVTRKQTRRIMKRAGLRAVYPGKRTSIPKKQHKVYPYLLRSKVVRLPNQVWATDITYIKLNDPCLSGGSSRSLQ